MRLQTIRTCLTIMLLAWILAACNGTDAEPTPQPAPAILADLTAPPAQSEAVTTLIAQGTSRLPQEVARLQLASAGVQLRDFRLDTESSTAYVTDSDYTLHIVTLEPPTLRESIATSGDMLTLDIPNQRLYIAPSSVDSSALAEVTVFDIADGVIIATVPGSRVAVDTDTNRVYIGDAPDALQNLPGVRLYEGATMQQRAQGDAGGLPIYNPARDELILVNNTAYTVDPETLAIRRDLFPEISNQPGRGCNGCTLVNDAWLLDSEEGTGEDAASVIAFDVTTIAPNGAGYYPPPRLLDAETLALRTDLQFGATCSSQPALLTSANGGSLLRHDYYSRYVVHNNLSVVAADQSVLVSKDGIGAPFVNAATGTAYVSTGSTSSFVLDSTTLDLLGVVAPWCVFTRAQDGTLYATDGAREALVVLAETGGAQLLPIAEPLANGLSDFSIRQILPSPYFAADATLFLVATRRGGGDVILRSTDAGSTFLALGGIPIGNDLSLTLALSPAFERDQTLFAAGSRGTYGGIGVWKSTTGGDSWTPHWSGMDHLRVNRIVPSPRLALDGALLAYADYVRIDPWQSGASLHRSDDAGITWTRVVTAETSQLLPAPAVYLPITTTFDLPVRKASYVDPIQYRVENGRWLNAATNAGAEETLIDILLPAAYPADPTIFIVTEAGVYRTQDSGASWQFWTDEANATPTFTTALTAAALSPLLGDDTYRMLLGTADGRLLQIDPATVPWQAAGASEIEASAPPATAEDIPSPAATASALITATSAVTATNAATATSVVTTATALTTPIAITPSPAPTVIIGATPSVIPNAEVTSTTAATTTITPLADTPPAGFFVPEGVFGERWLRDPTLQQLLGYARTATPGSTPAAYQFFQNGIMVWRGDEGRIYALLDGGTWRSFEDTFVEGEMERDPTLFTPGELLQPERGFGKIWRNATDLREQIGWATSTEQGITAEVHEFENGFVIRVMGLLYILTGSEQGSWQS